MEKLRHMVKRAGHGCWLLVVLLLLNQASTLHLHMHHADDSGASQSSRQIDLEAKGSRFDFQHHDDVHVIDLNADTFAKKWDGASMAALLTVLLLCLYLVPFIRPILLSRGSTELPPHSLYLISPPLRAPPHG